MRGPASARLGCENGWDDPYRRDLARDRANGYAVRPDTALARVVAVFGTAEPHHAYLFTNRRANRLKVLVHDGFGLWLAARRLHQGRFIWPGTHRGKQLALDQAQLHALVLGLPWQQLGDNGVISVL